MRTSCAPSRRPSSSARAPRSPTVRRLTVRDADADPSSASRCASLLDAAGRVPARGPAVRRRARAHARDHHRRRARRRAPSAWLAAGAKVLTRPARRRTAPASTSPPRSSCSPGSACSRRWSRAARSSRARCSRRGSSTGSSPTSRRRCSARDGRPAFDLAGPATHRRRATAGSWSTSPASATDVRLDYEPTGSVAERGGGLMFTGIVEELGTVRRDHAERRRRAHRDRRHARARRRRDRRVDRGERLLPHRRRARRRRLGRRRGHRDPRPHRPRRARAGDRVNLERPVRLADRLGGHLVQGHVDAVGTIRGTHAAGRRLGAHRRSPRRRRCCATSSRRARSPSTASASPWPRSSTTTAFERRGDPAHARGHHAGHEAAGRPREPRSRHGRQVRGASAGHAAARLRSTEHAVHRDRASRRRHRTRRARRRRRRRRPRERGRPHHGGREDDARGDGVHDPPHERRDLHAGRGSAASTSCGSR